MAVWEFNRGEWTEAYVFLRLLGEGRIYGATTDLLKDDLTYVDIINVIRDEPDKLLIFERFIENEDVYVKSSDGVNIIRIITAPELTENAAVLYNQIKTVAGDRKISIPNIQEYLQSIDITSPKPSLSKAAKDKYGEKTDIIVTTEDSFDHIRTTSGFSIKSHIGSPPTLFNSSQTSGFVYRITKCDKKGMYALNALDSFVEIIKEIKAHYSLEYVGCRNDVFLQNICIIDSRMDEILQRAVLIQSGYVKTLPSNNLADIGNALIEDNPIKIKNPNVFYPAKLKAFLFASFAGMTASNEWNGRKKLTGGYIDVDREGEMLYYRAVSDDIFENYLYKHTFFDRPDRGVEKELAVYRAKTIINKERDLTEDEVNSIIYRNGKNGSRNPKKGDYGYVFQIEDEFYIAINFQIRFR